ncbi:hypothetical protein ABK040_010972 [Willaertia magna]
MTSSPITIITSLDSKLIGRICSYLSSTDICSFSLLNKLINDYFSTNRDEDLWKVLIFKRFPELISIIQEDNSYYYFIRRSGWKKLFIHASQILKRYQSGLFKCLALEAHYDSVTSIFYKRIEINERIPKIASLLSGDAKGEISQWDLKSGLQMKSLMDFHYNNQEGKIIKIIDLGLRDLVASCSSGSFSNDASINVFNSATGEIYSTIKNVNQMLNDDELGPVQDFCAIGLNYMLTSVGNVLNVYCQKKKRNNDDNKQQQQVEYERIAQLGDGGHEYDIKCIKSLSKVSSFGTMMSSNNDSSVLVATSGFDSDICIWDVKQCQLIKKLKGHSASIFFLESFIENDLSVTLFSASNDGTFKVWRKLKNNDSNDFNCELTVKVYDAAPISLFTVYKDYNGIYNVATTSNSIKERTVNIYYIDVMNKNNNKQLKEEEKEEQTVIVTDKYIIESFSPVTAITLSHNRLATSSKDNTIRCYYSENNKTSMNEYKLTSEHHYYTGTGMKMLFSNDNSYLITGCSDSAILAFKFTPYYEWNYPVEDKDDDLSMNNSIYDSTEHAYITTPQGFSIDNIKKEENNLKPIIVKNILENLKGFEVSYLLYNVLSGKECKHLIVQTEKLKYEDCYGYNPNYRSNKRVIVEDKKTSDILFERIKDFVPKVYIEQNTGDIWDLSYLNSRWRYCRYTKGQHFLAAHEDGPYLMDKNTRSFYTFMMYINDGYIDGRTTFVKDRITLEEVDHVEPVEGLAICFKHENLHYGTVLKDGVKYLMRSELMYVRRNK